MLFSNSENSVPTFIFNFFPCLFTATWKLNGRKEKTFQPCKFHGSPVIHKFNSSKSQGNGAQMQNSSVVCVGS